MPTRKVSGQMRIEDSSSNNLGQFRQQGIGRGKLKGILPKPTLNRRLNPKKESSHRGKGGLVVIDPKGTSLHNKSSFTEASSFHSIGGMRLVNANIDGGLKAKTRKQEHPTKKGAIKQPKRKGGKDQSGKPAPANKGNKVPTKKSDVKKGNLKKMNKKPKKATKKQVGRPKKVLKAPREQPANNSAHFQ